VDSYGHPSRHDDKEILALLVDVYDVAVNDHFMVVEVVAYL
jgi:hypothetical protein